MHPAATASKTLRLVEVSPLGQKQNLYQTEGKRVYEERCRVEAVKSPVAWIFLTLTRQRFSDQPKKAFIS